MGVNPGSIAAQMPPQDDDLQRQIRDLRREIREQASAKTGAAMQIGSGGITVTDNGSITISGTGALNVGSGALNSGGSISAGTTITAGGNISSTGGSISAPAGNVSAGGNLTAGSAITGASLSVSGAIAGVGVGAGAGDVSTSASLRGTDIFATAAPGFNITGTRVAGWWESATGRGGTATSSRRFKTNIIDSGIDPHAVLSIGVKHYNYLAELAKRDDPNSPDYVGPDYHVHLEVGAIAEDMHAAGLWEFVIYQRDPLTETHTLDDGTTETVVVPGDVLHLDAIGQPVPVGIHYELFSLAVLVAAQFLAAQLQTVTQQVKTQQGQINTLIQRLQNAGIA